MKIHTSIKAILTTLILGSSSVALADPIYGGVPDPYREPYQEPYREPVPQYPQYPTYDGYDGAHGEHFDQRVVRRPVLLAQDLLLPTALNPRPLFLALDGRLANITKLRFQVDAGRAYIDNVTVLFADGHRQSMPVRQMLSLRNPSFTIALPHGGITGIYIHGRQMLRGNRYDADYRSYGYGYRPGRAALDVIGLPY